MEPHVAARPDPDPPTGGGAFRDVVESDGFPPSAALSSIPELADAWGISLNAVTRAIEDLGRSGYRPLRPRPAALQP
jgi:hypothetical protein